jgi:P2X purinoceptor 4
MEEEEEKISCSTFLKQLLYYHTVKVVQIRSWKLGLMYYLSVLCVLLYVGIWAIYLNHGYQSSGSLIGNTNLKVKGTAYYFNKTINQPIVWDAENVVYPPKEPDALFITTSFFETLFQKRSICEGNNKETEICPCPKRIYESTTNGISTGNCSSNHSWCLIWAWCPVENEEIPTLLTGIQNFTIFIRVTIKFPKYGVSVNNIKGNNLTFGYNLFTVNDIIEQTGNQYSNLSMLGAVIAVIISWDCNLDYSIDNCNPNFQFIRVDDTDIDSISKGYNFRYAYYYYLEENSQLIHYRDLKKVYGIRFFFLLAGQARKFDIVPLIINIGSGLALLSIATIICDFITLFLLPDRQFYNKVKFEKINENILQNKKRSKGKQEDEESINETSSLLKKPINNDNQIEDVIKF